MVINIDLLDEVREELENQESGTGRPSVVALRGLTQADLKYLALLTEFRGSLDELLAYAVAFRGFTGTREVLERSRSEFVELGLLQVDDRDRGVFAGDQFDEVYARYYAATREVDLFITPWNFSAELGSALVDGLAATKGVGVMGWRSEDHNEMRAKLEEALAVLTSVTPTGTALPELAASPLYALALPASETGSLTLGLLTAKLAGTETAAWFVLQDDLSEDELMLQKSLVELASNCAEAGGEVAVVFYSYPLPERELIVANAVRLASPAQLDELAERHVQAAYAAYGTGDYRAAAREAGEALRLVPTAQAATMSAHLKILTGDFERALLDARQALDLAQEADDTRVGIATYDLGVALLLTGDQAGAEEVLRLAAQFEEPSDEVTPLLIDLVPGVGGTWQVNGDRAVETREAAAELLELLRAQA